MIKEAINEAINGRDLPAEMVTEVMREIMTGEATQAQMAAYLTALRMKGETIEEITASAEGMRNAGLKLEPGFPVMEIVGTGGDEVGTFNISTTTAFVVAAAGLPVAKHGNRSVSSRSGAADVLEKLGVQLSLTPEQNLQVLTDCGMCFLFAQAYHPAMKYVAPVRREMGARTIFNILGPLTNPAGATMQLLGAYDKALVRPLAQVLANLGVVRGAAVCGGDGLDEITTSAPTFVCEINNGELTEYEITPEQLGLKRCELADLIGGTPEENAAITKAILAGEDRGAKRDVVIMNAAVTLYLGGKADSIEDGAKLAAEIIDSGAALAKLDEFVAATNAF